MHMNISFKVCLLLSAQSLSLFGDMSLDAYYLLRDEGCEYARYCETNCQNEVQSFLKATNSVATLKVSRQGSCGISNVYDGAMATNVVFFIEKKNGSSGLYRIIVYYEDGNTLDVSYTTAGISRIYRKIKGNRYVLYQNKSLYSDSEEVECCDIDVVSDGRKFDLHYGPMRCYRDKKLIREVPPCKLSDRLLK